MGYAYLVVGPEDGKRDAAAREHAVRFLCDGAKKPCGRCAPCREIATERCADFACIETPAAGEGSPLSAEELRESVSAFLQRRAAADRAKVLLLLRVDRLSPEAKDALLKPVEEPPEGAVIVLTAAHAWNVPETLRSRCRLMRISGDAAAGLEEFAAGMDLWKRFEAGERIEPLSSVQDLIGGKKSDLASRREKARRFLLAWLERLRSKLRNHGDRGLRSGEREIERTLQALEDLQRHVTPELVLHEYLLSLTPLHGRGTPLRQEYAGSRSGSSSVKRRGAPDR